MDRRRPIVPPKMCDVARLDRDKRLPCRGFGCICSHMRLPQTSAVTLEVLAIDGVGRTGGGAWVGRPMGHPRQSVLRALGTTGVRNHPFRVTRVGLAAR